MTALLLASWLATQEWSWDRVAPQANSPVDGYRIYWSTPPATWCTTGRVEVPQCADAGPGTRCNGETPEVPGNLVLFVVVAYNSAGESSTEHGPVTTCP